MDCENTSNDVAAELAVKLGEIAKSLNRSGLFTGQDIASAMMGVGLEVARQDQGAERAAEWLRRVADEIEGIQLRETVQ